MTTELNKTKKNIGLLRSWLIWFLPAIFMFYQYGVQVAPSLKIQYLKTHYLINNVEIGLLTTFYLLPYVLLQIPAGYIIDHYDVKKILTASMLVFTIGTLFIYFSNQQANYAFYAIGHILMGLSASTGFIGALYLANLWLSYNSYKLALSLTSMMSMLGIIAISLLFGFMLTFMHWSQLILINFVFGLVLTLLFWFFIKDTDKPGGLNLAIITKDIRAVINNKNIWLCGIYVGCAFAHIIVLTNAWRVDFLEMHYQLGRYEATIHNGYTVIGFIFGAPLFGLLAMKTNKLPLIILLSSAIEAVLLSICHYLISDLNIKIGFYVVFGFLSGNIVVGYALLRQLVDKHLLATAIGLANMVEIGIGMLLVPLVGELITTFNGNYELAVTPVIIVSYLATVTAFVLWRNVEV